MAAKWQRIKIQLDEPIKDEDAREVLGDLIVERIVERTSQGKDVDGNRFPAYSPKYKESLDFKIAGKGNTVDLQLSGDMLASLKVLKHTRNWIEVGFDKNSDENARADGNIRGTYGQKTPIPGKARNFLGISDEDLLKLVKYVKKSNSRA
jgi:hypothetical protein